MTDGEYPSECLTALLIAGLTGLPFAKAEVFAGVPFFPGLRVEVSGVISMTIYKLIVSTCLANELAHPDRPSRDVRSKGVYKALESSNSVVLPVEQKRAMHEGLLASAVKLCIE